MILFALGWSLSTVAKMEESNEDTSLETSQDQSAPRPPTTARLLSPDICEPIPAVQKSGPSKCDDETQPSCEVSSSLE